MSKQIATTEILPINGAYVLRVRRPGSLFSHEDVLSAALNERGYAYLANYARVNAEWNGWQVPA